MTSKKFSNIPVTNGTATTTFTPTAEEVGTHNLTAKYIQNDTYKETISIPVNLTINEGVTYTIGKPTIQERGSTHTIVITVPLGVSSGSAYDITGSGVLIINNNQYTATVKSGRVKFLDIPIENGTYEYTTSYYDDNNVLKVSRTDTVTIKWSSSDGPIS